MLHKKKVEIRSREGSTRPYDVEVVDTETGKPIKYIRRIEIVLDVQKKENTATVYLLPEAIRLKLAAQAEIHEGKGKED